MMSEAGWNRVIWGGDWPFYNHPRDLATWKRPLDYVLADCSEDEIAPLYHRNARLIYQLKPLP